MYAIERTLKTSRILVRSDFQAVIFSLSFFAWRCRETTFRLPCLTIPVWIAATALRSERKYRELVTQSVHRNWFSPRRQLLDCLAHGVIEVVQPLPTQRGRCRRQRRPAQVRRNPSGLPSRPRCISDCNRSTNTRRLTLIIARITLTEPKTAFAGVILESSFARFKASMAASNTEIAPSRPLGRRSSTSIVET